MFHVQNTISFNSPSKPAVSPPHARSRVKVRTGQGSVSPEMFGVQRKCRHKIFPMTGSISDLAQWHRLQGLSCLLGRRADACHRCPILLSGLPFAVTASSRQSSLMPLVLGIMLDVSVVYSAFNLLPFLQHPLFCCLHLVI